MASLHEELANILDVQRVMNEDRLRSFDNWDSLTILSICAMVDARFHVSLNAAELGSLETVGDLAALVARRAPR